MKWYIKYLQYMLLFYVNTLQNRFFFLSFNLCKNQKYNKISTFSTYMLYIIGGGNVNLVETSSPFPLIFVHGDDNICVQKDLE